MSCRGGIQRSVPHWLAKHWTLSGSLVVRTNSQWICSFFGIFDGRHVSIHMWWSWWLAREQTTCTRGMGWRRYVVPCYVLKCCLPQRTDFFRWKRLDMNGLPRVSVFNRQVALLFLGLIGTTAGSCRGCWRCNSPVHGPKTSTIQPQTATWRLWVWRSNWLSTFFTRYCHEPNYNRLHNFDWNGCRSGDNIFCFLFLFRDGCETSDYIGHVTDITHYLSSSPVITHRQTRCIICTCRCWYWCWCWCWSWCRCWCWCKTDADVDAHVTQVRAIRKKIVKSHERLYRIVPGHKGPRPIFTTTFFSCVVPTRTSTMADITHPILDCSNCVVPY